MNEQYESSARGVRAAAIGACLSLALALFAASAQSNAADDAFQSLIDQIPRSANAVVLLNMEKAKQSPMGLKQDWTAKIENAFESGLIRVPPQAARFVLASQIDLEFMQPIWEAAIADLDKDYTLRDVLKGREGTLDVIENLPAFVRPNDTYIVQLGPKTLGAMGPANRQTVVRWIREIHKPSPTPLSPYLQKAATFSDEAGSEIIMAIDLEGTLSFERVGKYLKQKQERLDKWEADPLKLAKLLSNVQGMRVGVRIGEEPSAKIVVDFYGDASMMAPFAKSLLLQVLSDLGASINDLQSWTAQVKGEEVSLTGRLSQGGLRRLLSVIDSPAGEDTVAKAPEVSPGNLPAIRAKNSLDHFHAVTGMFNDLKADMRNSKNLASNALWFDKYARRIERLPVLNVDEELLDYSAFVADSMRRASGSVKTMGIQSNVREKSIISSSAGYGYATRSYGRYGRYGGYGGVAVAGVYSPRAEMKGIAAERRVVAAEERAGMATDVQGIRQEVIAATTDMRRKMTQKYQIEF